MKKIVLLTVSVVVLGAAVAAQQPGAAGAAGQPQRQRPAPAVVGEMPAAFRQVAAETADMADRKTLGRGVHRDVGVNDAVAVFVGVFVAVAVPA